MTAEDVLLLNICTDSLITLFFDYYWLFLFLLTKKLANLEILNRFHEISLSLFVQVLNFIDLIRIEDIFIAYFLQKPIKLWISTMMFLT